MRVCAFATKHKFTEEERLFQCIIVEFMGFLKAQVTLNMALLRGAERITMFIGS
jgi:hypothetical protein